ncbi:MAG: di-trans,poly-cis-decaprenylcistransferase [Candidatus Woesearchaeota archaeon]|nr:MAG: di-trans,poly-cis-decaprenylcistransferase [Candidatus Woesearchaeota archaeon]
MGMPKHVGIIADGNRRFARKQVLAPWKGHRFGIDTVFSIVEWAAEKDITELTFYTLSKQNLNREKEELEQLFLLIKEHLPRAVEKAKEKNVRIKFIGDRKLLPEDVQEVMNTSEQETSNGEQGVVNFAMAYGGREEILSACKALANQVAQGTLTPEEITEEQITNNLYLASEPELIIRTGGEKRTSNFLPWQSTYAEWAFLETLFPALTKEEFFATLDEFSKRDRRFGK